MTTIAALECDWTLPSGRGTQKLSFPAAGVPSAASGGHSQQAVLASGPKPHVAQVVVAIQRARRHPAVSRLHARHHRCRTSPRTPRFRCSPRHSLRECGKYPSQTRGVVVRLSPGGYALCSQTRSTWGPSRRGLRRAATTKALWRSEWTRSASSPTRRSTTPLARTSTSWPARLRTASGKRAVGAAAGL